MKKLVFAFLFLSAYWSNAQVFDTAFWIPNGPVHSILKNGNDIIIGGDFDYVGKATGAGIPLDTNTGLPRIPNFPKVEGKIYAVAADAWGGWYIGGEFESVGGIPRKNLARISKTGLVYPTFNPSPDGPVYALKTIPIDLSSMVPRPNVYVGGNFTIIGGKPRNSLALLNPYNGIVYEGWKPSINGTVYCLELIGSGVIMIGGSFSTVDNIQRSNLAKITAWTNGGELNTPPHQVIASFNANVNGPVRAIYFNTNRYSLYIAGSFSVVSNKPRNYLAEIDYSDDTATAWNPNPNAPVYCFARKDKPNKRVPVGPPPIDGKIANWIIENSDTNFLPTQYPDDFDLQILDTAGVIVGGLFSQVSSIPHRGIAEINYTTGLPTNFNPQIDGDVYTITYDNKKNLYIGGSFDSVGLQPHRNIAKTDSNGIVDAAFNVHLSDAVKVISLADSVAYVGGDFICRNGSVRKSIAIIGANGQANSFQMNINGPVYAMKLKSNNLYFGGSFTSVNLQTRNRIAGCDVNSSQLLSINPSCNGTVRTMELVNNKLFIGGYFGAIGNSTRVNAGCVNLTNNTVTPWSPIANGTINYLKYNNGIIYAGGYFTQIGSTNRMRFAALDTIGGYAYNFFATDPDDGVYSFDFYGSSAIAGGWFSNAGGNNRENIFSANLSSGIATSFNPAPDNSVRTVYVNNNNLFVGGYFNTIYNANRKSFAQVDLTSGTLTNFAPSLNFAPYAFLQDGTNLYVAGEFKVIDGDVRAYFAKLNLNYIASTPSISSPESNFSVYPNPASEQINIYLEKTIDTDCAIEIRNALGELVFETTLRANEKTKSLNIAVLKSGLYFVSIKSKYSVVTKKFIKN
jgi:hypothetical protein